MKNYICDKHFYTYKISDPVVNVIIFSLPKNTKYLVPSSTLINPFLLLNLIMKGLKALKVLYETL